MIILLPDPFEPSSFLHQFNDRLDRAPGRDGQRAQAIEAWHRGARLFLPGGVLARGLEIPSLRLFTGGHRGVALSCSDSDLLAPCGYDDRWAAGTHNNLELVMALEVARTGAAVRDELRRHEESKCKDEATEIVRQVVLLGRTAGVDGLPDLAWAERRSWHDLRRALSLIEAACARPRVHQALLAAGVPAEDIRRVPALRAELHEIQTRPSGKAAEDPQVPLYALRGLLHLDFARLADTAVAVLSTRRAREYQLRRLFPCRPRRARGSGAPARPDPARGG